MNRRPFLRRSAARLLSAAPFAFAVSAAVRPADTR